MSGRLAFFSSATLDVSTVEKLSKQLREALGAYARSDRLVASANDFGVAEVLADRSSVTLIVSEHLVRLVDRRLVGADWLRKPAPVSGPPPRFVFASLKGGSDVRPHFPWQPRTLRPGAYEFSQSTLIWKPPAWARCF
jgi:hypothetical protein